MIKRRGMQPMIAGWPNRRFLSPNCSRPTASPRAAAVPGAQARCLLRSIFTLRPDIDAMDAAPLSFQVHTLIGVLLIAV